MTFFGTDALPGSDETVNSSPLSFGPVIMVAYRNFLSLGFSWLQPGGSVQVGVSAVENFTEPRNLVERLDDRIDFRLLADHLEKPRLYLSAVLFRQHDGGQHPLHVVEARMLGGDDLVLRLTAGQNAERRYHNND